MGRLFTVIRLAFDLSWWRLFFDGRWCHKCGRTDRVPWRGGEWTCWDCDLTPPGKPAVLCHQTRNPVA